MSKGKTTRTAIIWADVAWQPLAARIRQGAVQRSRLQRALKLVFEATQPGHHVYVNVVNGQLSKQEVQIVKDIRNRRAFHNIIVRQILSSPDETEWLIILDLKKRGQKDFSREDAMEVIARVFSTFDNFETSYSGEPSFEVFIEMTNGKTE
ncbi:MAG TPA: hypothetical protein VD907_03730 [Verrucomicrobiae bacterium]|nr:hypothetical protein [Verrucomicrobiae bacterium]